METKSSRASNFLISFFFKWGQAAGCPTYRNGPDGCDLQHGFGSGVEAAVLYGVADGDVAVQGDGAQVHDGRSGKQNVQIDPDWAESAGQRPGIVWTAGGA